MARIDAISEKIKALEDVPAGVRVRCNNCDSELETEGCELYRLKMRAIGRATPESWDVECPVCGRLVGVPNTDEAEAQWHAYQKELKELNALGDACNE